MIKAHQLLIKVATRTYLNISWSIIAKFTHRKKMRKFSCSQNLLILIKTDIFPCPGTMITPPILIMLRISDKRVPLFDSVLCIFRISSIIADSVSLLAPYIFSLLFFHQRYLFYRNTLLFFLNLKKVRKKCLLEIWPFSNFFKSFKSSVKGSAAILFLSYWNGIWFLQRWHVSQIYNFPSNDCTGWYNSAVSIWYFSCLKNLTLRW